MDAFTESRIPHQRAAIKEIEDLLDVRCSCGGRAGSVWCPIHDENELAASIRLTVGEESPLDKIEDLEAEIEELESAATETESAHSEDLREHNATIKDLRGEREELFSLNSKLEQQAADLVAANARLFAANARLEAELEAHKSLAVAVTELVQTIDARKSPGVEVAVFGFMKRLEGISVPE